MARMETDSIDPRLFVPRTEWDQGQLFSALKRHIQTNGGGVVILNEEVLKGLFTTVVKSLSSDSRLKLDSLKLIIDKHDGHPKGQMLANISAGWKGGVSANIEFANSPDGSDLTVQGIEINTRGAASVRKGDLIEAAQRHVSGDGLSKVLRGYVHDNLGTGFADYGVSLHIRPDGHLFLEISEPKVAEVAVPEILDTKVVLTQEPTRIRPVEAPQPISEDLEKLPPVAPIEANPSHVVAYEAELDRLRLEQSAAGDTEAWDLYGRIGRQIDELQNLGPVDFARQKGIPIGDMAPVEDAKSKTPEPTVDQKQKLEVCKPDEIREGAEFAELIKMTMPDGDHFVLIWGKDGKVYSEATDREGTRLAGMEALEAMGYSNIEEVRAILDADFEKLKSEPGDDLKVERHLPIYKDLSIEESLEQDRIRTGVVPEPAAVEPSTPSDHEKIEALAEKTGDSDFSNSPSNLATKLLLEEIIKDQKRLETDRQKAGINDFLKIKAARKTSDELLDAEANYTEFNKSPIHAEDPRRQTVYGPSVAERKRKYARLLDMTLENHRNALLEALDELQTADKKRVWENPEATEKFTNNEKEIQKMLYKRGAKKSYNNLNTDEKLKFLHKLDSLLNDQVSILGLQVGEESEGEEKSKRENRQSVIQTLKEGQQEVKKRELELSPRKKDEAIIESPKTDADKISSTDNNLSSDSINTKFESKVEVPQEIIDASGANISKGVATEVDRFFVTPDKDRRVVRYFEGGKENYHFVRLQRLNKQGKDELRLRYFYLLDGDEIEIKDEYIGHTLKDEELNDLFLVVFRDFQREIDEGKIESFEMVNLDSDFTRRLAKLNEELVEQNRLKQRAKNKRGKSGN